MAPFKIESLEDLLNHVISEYQQVATVPSGIVKGNPYKADTGGTALNLIPKCAFEVGYPRTFGEFYSGQAPNEKKIHTMSKSEAFAWFSRSRLRYSCSTVVASFARFLIPKLKKKGTSSLYSKTLDQYLDLGYLEIYEVGFAPTHQHTLVFERGVMKLPELVEPLIMDGLCHHTILKCSATGAIVDMTLGQFTGTVTPRVFKNTASFVSAIPGTRVGLFPCSEESIQQQIARDESLARLSPDAVPRLFALRVIRSLQEEKTLCWKCLCPPTSSQRGKLMQCSRCKEATYCSKECQVLSWKEGHKEACLAAAAKATALSSTTTGDGP